MKPRMAQIDTDWTGGYVKSYKKADETGFLEREISNSHRPFLEGNIMSFKDNQTFINAQTDPVMHNINTGLELLTAEIERDMQKIKSDLRNIANTLGKIEERN